MKIAITSMGKDLNSETDPRFGRCQYFIIYETETGHFVSVRNPHTDAGNSAGIKTATLIKEYRADAVLTGNVGRYAYRTLSASGIQIIAGVVGTISEAVKQFNANGPEYKNMGDIQNNQGRMGFASIS